MAPATPEGKPRLLDRLRLDHRRMSRVLSVFEVQTNKLKDVNGDPDLGLLVQVVDYLASYPNEVHHPLEDWLFDHVVNQGLTPSEAGLISIVLGQHAKIGAATSAIGADIQVIARGAAIDVSVVGERASTYLDLQRNHMELEERELFLLAERMLSADDLFELEIEALNHQNSAFDDRLSVYENLYDHIVNAASA